MWSFVTITEALQKHQPAMLEACRHLKSDAEGNCAVAQFIHVDGARNIIFDARTKQRTPIAVVGLRDSILVLSDDATLLAHKSQAQKVKELVAKLSASNEYKSLV